jgi:hypothetical protein
MMKKSLIALVVSAALLSACGGSDEKNQAPILTADAATTLNDSVITVDVLANDSDPDGDALTISAVGKPDIGDVVITNNTLVYTPSAQAMGDVSFSYEVTDGELSASSTVTITNQQSVTITGIATDAPINNGEVTATNDNGDVVASATTDSNGTYSLPILVSEDPGYLVLNANGVGEQAHVSLVSRVGDFLDLRALASENGTTELSDAMLLESKITHVSTALSIMYTEYVNDGGEASFDVYVAEADFEKVLGLASFIKVLADNDDFSLPDGTDTVSFFVDSEENILSTIRVYLNGLGLINEDGTYADAYADAINTARVETLEDDTLQQSYSESSIAGKTFATYSAGAYLATKGSAVYTFNDDGTGSKSSAENYYNIFSDSVSWSVDDGVLVVANTDATPSLEFPPSPSNYLEYFDEETVLQILAADEEGYSAQWRIEKKPVSESFELVYENGGNAIAHVSQVIELKITPAVDESYGAPKFVTEYPQTYTSIYSDTSEAISLSREDVLASPWVVAYNSEFEYSLNDQEGNPVSLEGMISDYLTFNDDNTVTSRLFGTQGSWSFDSGTISLSVNGKSFTVTPFKKQNDYLIAVYEYEEAGNVIKYAADMHSIDFSLPESFDVTSTPPMVWASTLNASLFVNDLPLAEDLWSYYFDSDGTAGRVFAEIDYFDPDLPVSRFVDDRALYNFQWQKEGDLLTLDGLRENSAFVFQRRFKWDLLGVTDSGLMATIEYQVGTINYSDGYSDAPFGTVPRLNFYMPLNLEEAYPEIWANTEINGLNTPDSQSNSSVSSVKLDQ